MAASASHSSQQQHRCVFVGNIPYDATEEQLIQICEEVGPVVSFRLVIDRETGKPKGYGFCEYKDEETALSARRNLQGYEINGRQLRVDFAENDKNADRNRDQGRGGPGMATNFDPQRQFGGPAVIGDSSFLQPMGVSAAIAAATSMTRALGAAQTGNLPSQIGQQSHQAPGRDPLTLHLAKMSRIQLNEIMFELKAIATQNQEQARQILLSLPNLPKAIFQAQFMLGMITEQMLQMPKIRPVVAPPPQPLVADVQKGQLQVAPTVSGLPPLPLNMQVNFSSLGQETQIFSGLPSSVQSQHVTLLQSRAHNQIQFPQPTQNQGLQHDKLSMQPGTSTFPSMRPQPLGNLSTRPHIQLGPSISLRQETQVSLPQYPGQIITLGHNPQMSASLLRSSLPDQGLQASLSSSSSMLDNPNKAPHRSQVTGDSTTPDLATGLSEEGKMVNNRADPNGRGATSSMDINLASSVSRPSPSNGFFEDYLPIGKAVSNSEKQVAPVQLPPQVESALLQQVLNLTPEQLSSLPPDQQQQVIQLQQVLRESR